MIPALGVLFLVGGASTLIAVVGSSPPARRSSAARLPPAPSKPRTYAIGGGLPAPTLEQVINALQDGTPAQLEALARDLEKQFPLAAAALRQRASEFGPAPDATPGTAPSGEATPTQPTSAPPQSSAAGSNTAPLGTPPATAGLPALDQGMPPEWQRAVWGALATEYDPDALRGLASHLKEVYPAAAALLFARAARLAQPPVSAPPASTTIPVSLAPATAPPQAGAVPTPAAAMSSAWPPPEAVPNVSAPSSHALPSAAEVARRNAGRPSGYPYITLRGEATYPAQIAREATGNEMNYPQLSALNPQFVKDGSHWMNIQVGDEINIPSGWKQALSSRYHITDSANSNAPVAVGAAGPAWATGVPFTPLREPTRPTPQSSAAVPVPGAPIPLEEPADASHVPPPVPVPPAVAPTPIQNLPNPEPPDPSREAIPIGHGTNAALADENRTGGTYAVKSGDFPIKIAKALVGDGNRWHELVAANPSKKRKADGNFATLVPGEVLHLPASWSSSPSARGSVALLGGAHAANA